MNAFRTNVVGYPTEIFAVEVERFESDQVCMSRAPESAGRYRKARMHAREQYHPTWSEAREFLLKEAKAQMAANRREGRVMIQTHLTILELTEPKS